MIGCRGYHWDGVVLVVVWVRRAGVGGRSASDRRSLDLPMDLRAGRLRSVRAGRAVGLANHMPDMMGGRGRRRGGASARVAELAARPITDRRNASYWSFQHIVVTLKSDWRPRSSGAGQGSSYPYDSLAG